MIKHIVIAGGGTAGWMSAVALSAQLSDIKVTLVESPSIPTVGVGEATIPPLRSFHRLCDIPEDEFMQASNATFKLGIEFDGWGKKGDSYIHSFGKSGKGFWAGEFQHFWLRGKKLGMDLDVGDFCVEHEAAKKNKFSKESPVNLNYAYHLDAGLYVKYLEKICMKRGMKKILANIVNVNLDQSTGAIESLLLDNEEILYGDFFIDCTGFKALLAERALRTGYESWSNWLINDTAVAVQSEVESDLNPYTKSIAHNFGWRWKIPLQSRTGNGFVFSKDYISVDQAHHELTSSIGEDLVNEPRTIHFQTGVRKRMWNKNCVAVGLSSGFIEPLESTSIHLIMSSVMWLIKLFPRSQNLEYYRSKFNSALMDEMVGIRDFIILHYYATSRDDTSYWSYCANMEIPDSLKERIELFKECGQIFKSPDELFRVDSWFQVLIGQGVIPERYHPLVDSGDDKQFMNSLNQFRLNIERAVENLPFHTDYINQYCKSSLSEKVS